MVAEAASQVAGGTAAFRDSAISELGPELRQSLKEFAHFNDFAGKEGSSVVTARRSGHTRLVAVVGLGKRAAPAWGPPPLRALGEAAAAMAKTHKSASLALVVMESRPESLAAAAVEAAALTSGLLLGGYEATRFKREAKRSPLERATFFSLWSGESVHAASARAAQLAAGVALARSLVELPPNICSPPFLAEVAALLAAQFPDVLQLEVLERDECERRGMGLYLAVASASDHPPKFIHLTYRAPGDAQPGASAPRRIALVGKALTFDTGGYNLKVNCCIELMKQDMAGSAAVLGAARALAELAPAGVEVHFIAAACENMVGSRGMLPSDVLTASNGKTVEVLDTDAEGRLCLADSLVFAESLGCEAVVDIATLTGATIAALGDGIAGLFSPDDQLAAAVLATSREAGERIWRMPIERSYRKHLDSMIADMKNWSPKGGGAITAALFLQEFISTDKVAWAHIDAPGPVWDDGAGGATGFGVASLVAVAQGFGTR